MAQEFDIADGFSDYGDINEEVSSYILQHLDGSSGVGALSESIYQDI